MNTIFTNSKNSKKFDPHKLLLHVKDKINLKRSDKDVAVSNLSMYYTCKKWKGHIRRIILKYQLQHGIKNLNYLMDLILYQIFKTFFEYISKKDGEKTVNPSIRIYVNKIDNIITFEIKAGYYIKLLSPEKMEYLGRTKSRIAKDENAENVPYLEVVLLHRKFVNNKYQQNSTVMYTLVPNKYFGQY